MSKGVFGLIALIFASTVHADEGGEKFGVIYSESRPFYFTGGERPDTLTVQYLGENCRSTVALFTVRRAGDDFPVFIKSQPVNLADPEAFPEFRNIYQRCEQSEFYKDGVSERFWGDQRAAVVDDRLTFVPLEMRDGLMLHVSEREAANALGSQLLCFSEGYESTNCYWFDPAQGARLFLSYGL